MKKPGNSLWVYRKINGNYFIDSVYLPNLGEITPLNIGEIPEPIPNSGDILSQLVGPWIDQVSENYYAISPLLKDAAKAVWSDDTIKRLQANIANAILKTKKLTPTEAWTVFTHSMAGENKEGLSLSFIH